MSDEAAIPEEDETTADEGGEGSGAESSGADKSSADSGADNSGADSADKSGADADNSGADGAGNSPHSPDPADQVQNVREVTDSADASADSAGTDAAGTSASDGHAATSEPEAEGSGSEAEQPSVDETSNPTPDQSVSDSSGPEAEGEPTAVKSEAEPAKEKAEKPAVPGADLEPIALEPDKNLSAEERARLEAEAEEERARREAELAAESAEEEVPAREPAKLDKDARFRATGKRKSAIARVTLLPGDGAITVNGRSIEEYFPRSMHQTLVRQPLVATGYDSALEVRVRVHGGGISGQASAVRHGIARALTEIDLELRGDLKRRGYLTRDARVKERRKAGFKKARKRPQFSKR